MYIYARQTGYQAMHAPEASGMGKKRMSGRTGRQSAMPYGIDSKNVRQ